MSCDFKDIDRLTREAEDRRRRYKARKQPSAAAAPVYRPSSAASLQEALWKAIADARRMRAFARRELLTYRFRVFMLRIGLAFARFVDQFSRRTGR